MTPSRSRLSKELLNDIPKMMPILRKRHRCETMLTVTCSCLCRPGEYLPIDGGQTQGA